MNPRQYLRAEYIRAFYDESERNEAGRRMPVFGHGNIINDHLVSKSVKPYYNVNMCHYCHKRCATFHGLQEHLLTTRQHKVFLCCNRSFPAFSSLAQHVRARHGWVLEVESDGSDGDSNNGIDKHADNDNGSGDEFAAAPRQYLLSENFRAFYKDETPRNRYGRRVPFSGSADLFEHAVMNPSIKQYYNANMCHYCVQEFNTFNELTHHLFTTNLHEVYLCCNRSFPSFFSLSQHASARHDVELLCEKDEWRLPFNAMYDENSDHEYDKASDNEPDAVPPPYLLSANNRMFLDNRTPRDRYGWREPFSGTADLLENAVTNQRIMAYYNSNRCHYCREEFRNFNALQNHLFTTSRHEVYLCCNRSFTNFISLAQHAKSRHHVELRRGHDYFLRALFA
jgi:hypothetical protein